MTTHHAVSPNGPEYIPGCHPDAAALAASKLRAGGVVAIPTDTVYGLAAAIDQPRAIERIYALKQRPASKAIPVLLSDPAGLVHVATRVSPIASVLAACFWPGALTLVLPALPHLPEAVTSTDDDGTRTVAVRVPDHGLARRIIAAAGGAIAVTSANRSGQDPALDALQALDLEQGTPDVVVDGGPVAGGVPSTIVLVLNSSPRILREGAIPAPSIELAIAGDATCAVRETAPSPFTV